MTNGPTTAFVRNIGRPGAVTSTNPQPCSCRPRVLYGFVLEPEPRGAPTAESQIGDQAADRRGELEAVAREAGGHDQRAGPVDDEVRSRGRGVETGLGKHRPLLQTREPLLDVVHDPPPTLVVHIEASVVG